MRKLGHLAANPFDPFVADFERKKIGIREVTVVHRVFLRAHLTRLALVRVIEAGGLNDLAAVLDELDLATDFVVDGFLQEAEGIQVLDFTARAELLLADGAHGHVGVTAEVTLLHVAVRDAEPDHEGVKRAGVAHSFGGGAHFRFRHDLEKRRAGAIEIDAGAALDEAVNGLAGVFLKMSSRQVDGLDVRIPLLGLNGEGQLATEDDRQLELADLVALGQVRVEVVLAVENGMIRDRGVDGEAEADGLLNGAVVEHRQAAGKSQVNVAGVDVGLVAEVAGGAGKNLGTGRELNVRLKTDHNFPLHGLFLLRLSITGRTAKMPVRFTLPGSRDPEQTGFAERFAE